MDTTIDFRRKLLRFDRPLYPKYIKSNIPRYYASFFGSWKPNYTNTNCGKTHTNYYGIGFPLRDEKNSLATCYSQKTINPFDKFDKYILYIIVMCVIFAILLMCKKYINM